MKKFIDVVKTKNVERFRSTAGVLGRYISIFTTKTKNLSFFVLSFFNAHIKSSCVKLEIEFVKV